MSKQLSADDASLLAILAGNPTTFLWERLVNRIADPIAKQAGLIIVGQTKDREFSLEAAKLAQGILRWAHLNTTVHAVAGFTGEQIELMNLRDEARRLREALVTAEAECLRYFREKAAYGRYEVVAKEIRSALDEPSLEEKRKKKCEHKRRRHVNLGSTGTMQCLDCFDLELGNVHWPPDFEYA